MRPVRPPPPVTNAGLMAIARLKASKSRRRGCHAADSGELAAAKVTRMSVDAIAATAAAAGVAGPRPQLQSVAAVRAAADALRQPNAAAAPGAIRQGAPVKNAVVCAHVCACGTCAGVVTVTQTVAVAESHPRFPPHRSRHGADSADLLPSAAGAAARLRTGGGPRVEKALDAAGMARNPHKCHMACSVYYGLSGAGSHTRRRERRGTVSTPARHRHQARQPAHPATAHPPTCQAAAGRRRSSRTRRATGRPAASLATRRR